MVFPRVHRSGRTSIRATTRSLSASVNVTPFNSAKGIFIELTFSSGVMIGIPPVSLPCVIRELDPRIHQSDIYRSRHSGTVRRTRPGISRFRVRVARPRNDGPVSVRSVLETITSQVNYFPSQVLQ